jgi:hypothetical protein
MNIEYRLIHSRFCTSVDFPQEVQETGLESVFDRSNLNRSQSVLSVNGPVSSTYIYLRGDAT